TSHTDPAGLRTLYFYDPMGDVTSQTLQWKAGGATTYSDFSNERFEFDLHGRQTAHVDANNVRTVSGLGPLGDEINHIVQTWNGASWTTFRSESSGYDSLGQQTEHIDSDGIRTFTTYDAAGNMLENDYQTLVGTTWNTFASESWDYDADNNTTFHSDIN